MNIFKKNKIKNVSENSLNATSLLSSEFDLQCKELIKIAAKNKEKLQEISLKNKEKIQEISLKNQETMLSRIPEETHLIILIDIANFSKNNSRQQILYIYLFQKFLRIFNIQYFAKNKIMCHEAIQISNFIPTGDGCYMIANKCSANGAVDFLCSLISEFKKIKDSDGKNIPIRVGALIGKCIPFMDIAHHKNYFGDGMNETARVLTGGQHNLEKYYEFKIKQNSQNQISQNTQNKEIAKIDNLEIKKFSENSLFVDDSLKDALKAKKDLGQNLITIKNVTDKHGKQRDVTILRQIN